MSNCLLSLDCKLMTGADGPADCPNRNSCSEHAYLNPNPPLREPIDRRSLREPIDRRFNCFGFYELRVSEFSVYTERGKLLVEKGWHPAQPIQTPYEQGFDLMRDRTLIIVDFDLNSLSGKGLVDSGWHPAVPIQNPAYRTRHQTEIEPEIGPLIVDFDTKKTNGPTLVRQGWHPAYRIQKFNRPIGIRDLRSPNAPPYF